MRVLVLEHIVNGINVVIGMDAIDKLGGIAINQNHVQFSRAQCAVTNLVTLVIPAIHFAWIPHDHTPVLFSTGSYLE